MIPLSIPNLSGNEGKYLQECVETNFVSSVGPFVNRFEEKVAEMTEAKFCVATSSGTTALHAALVAVGVQRDDLVIVPSFTFIASANAIAHCCASPWLFDIDTESWTLNAEKLEYRLKEETIRQGKKLIHKKTGRRISAIMPVYTLGTPADMDSIMATAKEYGLPVVADAAAAIGARYKNKNIGGLADLSILSFNGNKTVTAGGGGAVVGNNKELVDLVRHLTTTARIGENYTHDMVGYNYRMTNIQAAVGCAQLEQLKLFISAKRLIRKRYDRALGSVSGVGLFPQPKWAESACWFSGITIDDLSFSDISTFCNQLKNKGIGARPFWKPIHLQPPYKGSPKTETHVADATWVKILTLPCSTNLSDRDQEFVIKTVNEILHTNLGEGIHCS